MIEKECEEIAKEHSDSKDVVRLKRDEEILVLPLVDFEKAYGILLLFSESFTDEEVGEIGILTALSRDVLFSLRSLRIEREEDSIEGNC